MFAKRNIAPASLTHYVSGQSEVRCTEHGMAICIDFMRSGYRCVVKTSCVRKSKWRCPASGCRFALCKKCFEIFKHNPFRVVNLAINDDVFDRNEKEDLSSSPQDEIDNELCEIEVPDLPIPSAQFCGNHVDTDAGITAVPLETTVSNDMKVIPLHGLLNSFMSVLQLIMHSKENIIGPVRKLWARAEFQTTQGNLPHYHVLIWLHLTQPI